MVDRNPKLFRERLSSFIEQVSDVDYVNLFLTNLGSVIFLLYTYLLELIGVPAKVHSHQR